jgi:hypothetical protein
VLEAGHEFTEKQVEEIIKYLKENSLMNDEA